MMDLLKSHERTGILIYQGVMAPWQPRRKRFKTASAAALAHRIRRALSPLNRLFAPDPLWIKFASANPANAEFDKIISAKQASAGEYNNERMAST